MKDLLSFYRASQRAFPGEDFLEEQRMRAIQLLDQKTSHNASEDTPKDYSVEVELFPCNPCGP